ncbi:VOC family protein [Cohnella lupini]|nr:glyoxalase/bleomycin resistance/extradiol dioxygenase family protein [Cohnella lupini]
MARLVPYIFSEDAKSQAEFYVKALGGEIRSVQTFGDLPGSAEELKNKVIHLDMEAAGVPLFLSDSPSGPIHRGNGTDLSLIFGTEDEAREAFAKLSEGGVVKDPLQVQFWGALFGRLEDKFGVSWQVSNEFAPIQS